VEEKTSRERKKEEAEKKQATRGSNPEEKCGSR
jgi:hypothetical protein